MKHTTHTELLPNGIRLLLIDVPDTSNFELVISIGAGYRVATKNDIERYEIPHVLEHMVFDGSSKHDTADELQAIFNAGGGEWNGVTSTYSTSYMFHNRVRNAESLLNAAFDAVFQPLLSRQSFDEETRVVANELDDSMNDFNQGADQYTQQQILPELVVSADTQLARLPNVEYDDVLRFHRKYYGTANTTVVALCDTKQLSFKKLQTLILDATKSAPKRAKVDIPTFEMAKSEGVVLPVEVAKAVGRSIASLQYVVKGHAEARTMILLGIFCTMLNGMNSYSVNHQLRKLGVAYGTAFSGLQSAETHGIELAIDADNEKFIEVLSHTLSLTQKFIKNGVTDEQFNRFMTETIESVDDAESSTDALMAWYFDDFVVEGTVVTPKQHRAMLQTIKKSEVFNLASEMFKFENQYGSIFTSKKFRGSVAVTAITESILKDNKEVDDDFINGYKVINGGFLSSVGDEVRRLQQPDPNAGPYRRMLIYINSRPALAWTLNVFKLVVVVFLGFQSAERFSSSEEWLGWLSAGLAAYLLLDVASDAFIRITDTRRRASAPKTL